MPASTSGPGRLPVVAAVLLLVVVALLAYWAGRSQSRVVEAEVGCLSAVGTISCELPDGWTVGVPKDVGWTDIRGASHEDGRPACLPPSGRGLEGPVRLSWVPAEVDGRSWRQVVWVTCLE